MSRYHRLITEADSKEIKNLSKKNISVREVLLFELVTLKFFSMTWSDAESDIMAGVLSLSISVCRCVLTMEM